MTKKIINIFIIAIGIMLMGCNGVDRAANDITETFFEGSDMELWNEQQLSVVQYYEKGGFKACEVVISGERYRALRSENGVIIVDKVLGDNEYDIYYGDSVISIYMGLPLGSDLDMLRVKFIDDVLDKGTYLVISVAARSDSSAYGYVIDMQEFKLISDDFDLNELNSVLKCRLDNIALEDGRLVAELGIEYAGDNINIETPAWSVDGEDENIDACQLSVKLSKVTPAEFVTFLSRQVFIDINLSGSSIAAGEPQNVEVRTQAQLMLNMQYDSTEKIYKPDYSSIKVIWKDVDGENLYQILK